MLHTFKVLMHMVDDPVNERNSLDKKKWGWTPCILLQTKENPKVFHKLNEVSHGFHVKNIMPSVASVLLFFEPDYRQRWPILCNSVNFMYMVKHFRKDVMIRKL